ncbi:MAG TPA: MopE-related protein [Candidatus Polarisedimenticolaceae bacterium]|nr:MopE-related protein [Candidatus Polarisedimenticolaceae bacterium]
MSGFPKFAAAAACAAACCFVHAQTVAPPFDADYVVVDLGAVPGLPPPYGGLTFTLDDPDTLLIGGAANTDAGVLYAVTVVRGLDQHITGFSGTAVSFAAAPFNDGGVAFGPGGVLFLARYPNNEIGEVAPGSVTTDKVVALGALGVAPSPGGLGFVPAGFPGAGDFKLVSWSGGEWSTLALAPDSSGTYDVTAASLDTQIVGGPEGFAYVPPGSPQFPDFTQLLVSEYSSGSIAVYDVDAAGNPVPASRVPFVTGLTGAEGATLDPRTGDFLFSTFGGGDHVIAVRGFAPLPEVCDGVDNDGDGETDEDFDLDAPCDSGVGACRADGVTVCAADGLGTQCNATPGAPVEEVCDNGIDDDCDGLTDGEDTADCSTCLDVELPGNTVDEDCDGLRACDPCGAWRNHGAFLSCVSRAVNALVGAGHLSHGEGAALVSNAARSAVGRRGSRLEECGTRRQR